ncbi:MAG TPA: ABC transporter permease [Planctomycetota bacterium]|nr:ABC transporter permease [Planctomycetota bacterium]
MVDGPSPPLASARAASDGTLVIVLTGDWTLAAPEPERGAVRAALGDARGRVSFDAGGLGRWDSRLVAFVTEVGDGASKRGLELDPSGLPEGARRLYALALAVPEREGARQVERSAGVLERLGAVTRELLRETRDSVDFLGSAVVALGRLATGRARTRRQDVALVIQRAGPEALLIVCMISSLVGLILAFVGAVQLALFGAQIYIASLVAVAMVRVMGAVMTGVIMAGRTGAAFAAELGSMEANEEIDALRTLGIPPMEFLVLPRVIGLTLMMPLLCVFADLMGVLGGALVGVAVLGLEPALYWNTTLEALQLKEFWIGLVHATVFGALIALTGCRKGMQTGRSAAAVGNATTSAVVQSIVHIVVATAVITVVCDLLGV